MTVSQGPDGLKIGFHYLQSNLKAMTGGKRLWSVVTVSSATCDLAEPSLGSSSPSTHNRLMVSITHDNAFKMFCPGTGVSVNAIILTLEFGDSGPHSYQSHSQFVATPEFVWPLPLVLPEPARPVMLYVGGWQ